MTVTTRSVLAVALCLLATAPFPGCGDDKTTVIQGGAELGISPPNIDFEHTVGRTGCPQEIGRIRIVNNGREEVPVRVNASAPLRVSPAQITLRAGQVLEVVVVFDCSQATAFTSTVTVEAMGQVQGQVRVQGNVHF